MVKRRKETQQTLEATLGRPRVRPVIKTPKAKSKSKGVLGSPASSSPIKHAKNSPMAPPSSFMHSSQVFGSATKKRVVLDDSSSEEVATEDDEVVKLPVRKTKRGKKREVSDSESGGGSSAEDDGSDSQEGDEDDEPVVNPAARRKRRIIADDSDDEPLIPSSVKRRRLVRPNTASSPVKDRNDEDEDKDDEPAPSSSVKPGRTRRKPLTQKEKARELLRRKRAGEVIPEENESSSSEDEEPTKALYDTDSDHLALEEFEDDEEGVLDVKIDGKDGKRKKEKKKQKVADDDDSDTSIDDFVVDDSDAPIGAPDEDMEVPLKHTSHYHKPLKEHFRFAIEWLVQFKVNPEFCVKEDEMYKIAWQKLDDEVRGLAISKFASSAWKTDFHLALRARPYFHNEELPKGVLEIRNCGACGRANHPARYTVTFSGKPYFKNTAKLGSFLQPVELSDNSEDKNEDEGDGEDEHEDNDEGEGEGEDEEEYDDEDEDGHAIPKESQQWQVGVNCNQNAETAHYLMHWKHELLDWVDTRLHQEGYMLPHKVAEREKMDPEEVYELVDKIMEEWESHGVVGELYHAFKGAIETARNQPTTGRRRW